MERDFWTHQKLSKQEQRPFWNSDMVITAARDVRERESRRLSPSMQQYTSPNQDKNWIHDYARVRLWRQWALVGYLSRKARAQGRALVCVNEHTPNRPG